MLTGAACLDNLCSALCWRARDWAQWVNTPEALKLYFQHAGPDRGMGLWYDCARCPMEDHCFE